MIIKVLKGTRAHGLTLVLPKATVDKMRDRLYTSMVHPIQDL